MLSNDRRYLFQMISASDGRRSEPFICDLEKLRETFCDLTQEEKDGMYLLVLADVGLEIKPQEFVSRFPIYRISTFEKLDLSTMKLPEEYLAQIKLDEEMNNG